MEGSEAMRLTSPAVYQDRWLAKLRRFPRAGSLSPGRIGLALIICAAASSGARADKVDDYVTAQMNRQHIPGLSLAVLKDGKPVKVRGYGVANLELGTRATPETVYPIGSVSKQFIAAGIVRLSAEGKIGLDDSIRKYLGDAPETWQAITVRHVLT